jgi:hypothetical protein
MSGANAARIGLIMLSLMLMLHQHRASAQTATAATAKPAMPLDATTAILDAFRQHAIVGIGDAHGNRQGEAFQLALIRDPRFPTVVNDIVVESGNSRYQDLVDRYVRGEDVPADALQRVWLDTTVQQVAQLEVPELFPAVRALNASLPSDRKLRILVAEPPIEWERMRTADDLRKWQQEPASDRDRFAVDLLRREVVAKNRRALLLCGAGHLFRKVVNVSMVTLLEEASIKPFTIWTNAAAEMATMQADVAKWPVPSLALLRGTTLGQIGLSDYFGPGGKDIPPQWQAPLQDQFDAVLYLGPLTSITLGRPTPWRCAEPAMAERLRRLELQRPALAERIKKECVP